MAVIVESANRPECMRCFYRDRSMTCSCPPPVPVKYYMQPMLFGKDDVRDDSDASRINQCACRRGHVLFVHDNRILCAFCPAEWKAQ